jgi:class 3 adenylate cyclase/DNA-binding transcriptional MerR regulator
MSLDELAALVDTPVDDLRAWTDAGLLDPARRGHYDELDLLRIMAIRHHGALGYAPDALAEALSSGDVEPYLGEYIYPRGPQLSIDDAAHELGLERDLLVSLRTALGFTRDTILEGDLKLFQAFHVMSDAVRGARVFGDALRRVAQTETRLVHVHMHEQLEVDGMEEEIIRQIEGLQQAVIPLLDGVVQRLHHAPSARRHRRRLRALGRHRQPRRTGFRRRDHVFIDVEAFTQLAEAEGDAAAMETMTRVDSAARGLALDYGGKVVKQIGDALMLAFRESPQAVRFATHLEQAVRADESLPGLRVGMHCGPAIYRVGDYVGTTVNVASRVTTQATAGETLMTEVVADRAGDGLGIEPAGVRMLRGMERPLALYRLPHQTSKRDPVCDQMVKAPPAARLQHDGDEMWFCSTECLRKYLDSEAAHATAKP